jgi:DNA-binding beta-propeller fold protein YncE
MRVSLPAVFLATIAAALMFSTAVAQATEIHVFSKEFAGAGTEPGKLKEPTGIAVNDGTHDVYVADSANNRVEVFNEKGVYQFEFNGSGSDLLVEGSAAPTGQFSSPGGVSGVAIDNSGKPVLEDPSVEDVYVIDRGHKVIDKFSSTGKYEGQLTGTCPSEKESEPAGTCEPSGVPVTPFNELDGVAVDSNGTLWVLQGNGEPGGQVDSFSDAAANEFLSTAPLQGYSPAALPIDPGFAVNSEDDLYAMFSAVSGGKYVVEFNSAAQQLAVGFGSSFGQTGVAVDLANNVVYIGSPTEAAAFSAEGALIEAFGSGHLAGGSGIAVDASDGTVYVADSTADAVKVFDDVPVPDEVATAPPSNVTPASVTLNGTVNPDGAGLTECKFEYVAAAEYKPGASNPYAAGQAVSCAQGLGTGLGEIGEGTEPVAVSANVPGLARYAVYHYRLVAADTNGSVPTPDAEFFTGGAGVLGESVAGVASSSATLQAQIDPNGVDTHYYFQYNTGGTEGCTASTCFDLPAEPGLDIGSAKGVQNVELPVQGLQPSTIYHYRVVTVQGGETLAGPDQTFTTQPAGTEFTLPDGRMWELVSPPDKGGAEIENVKVGLGGAMQASENGEAVTYIASSPVGAGGQSNPLDNQVLSTRGPDGWSSQDLDTQHHEATILEQREAGYPFPRDEFEEYSVFSPDLSLAYVHPEGTTPLAPPAPPSQFYVRDSSTGVFTSTTLTAKEWYAERVALAQGPPRCDAGASPAKEKEVDAVSQDGCYVYFNSKSILAPGASGTDPLYVSHYNGTEWVTTFIPLSLGFQKLSPNGQYVAFMSEASLTGYDNEDVTSGHAGERMDEEVYLYDAATNHLVCASCNPTGARPVGVLDPGEPFLGHLLVDRNDEWEGHWLAGSLPDWTVSAQSKPIYQPRYLSDDGKLFFDSPEALVAQDVNAQENVYEYETPASGEMTASDSCTTESLTYSSRSEGCVSLISSGTSSQESAFVDASASGDDVFFLTSSRLAPQDNDNSYDMYDAHVCSASAPCPASLALSPPPCETGDSCKPAPTPQPAIFGAPPSATFSGDGDITPAVTTKVTKKTVKCKRGYVKKKTKCVKRPKAKKAGNKRGAKS